MRRARSSTARHAGFTLVEVLVALVVMTIMAVMSWRGIDALLKSRDIAQTNLDQSARLQTVLAQWEQDLRSLQDSGVVDALSFDGATLRITREQPLGMQVIAWTLRDGMLYRWESQVVQTVQALETANERSTQFIAQDAQRLLALEGVSGWQMYFYRGNSWSNAQSSGNVATPAAPAASGGIAAITPQRQQLPTGVRMILQFAPATGYAGPLTRQIVLGAQS